MPVEVAATPAAPTPSFVERLALGTAQFGLAYGINNTAGRPTDATVHEILRTARAAGQVQRIGVSLYHPQEAEWLLAQELDFDLVQLPFNVLDQRFGPLLPALSQRGVEVHVRSAFLQGLLLRAPAALPDFFAPLAGKITRLRALAQEAGVPLAALLLLFAAFAPGASRVVVGVDTAANLRDNLAAAHYLAQAEQLRPALQQLAEITDTYILPYAWPPRS